VIAGIPRKDVPTSPGYEDSGQKYLWGHSLSSNLSSVQTLFCKRSQVKDQEATRGGVNGSQSKFLRGIWPISQNYPQFLSTKSRRATSQNLNHNSTLLSNSLAQQKHELEQVSISKKFPSSSVDSTKQNGNSSPLHTSKHKVENPTRTAAQPQWKRIRGAAHGPRTGV
jgi:hypothetical protein